MTRLDGVVTPDEQREWLAMAAPRRVRLQPRDDRVEAGRFGDRYERLKTAPGWPKLRQVLRTYLDRCSIEPFATEGDFWSATCNAD